MAAGLLYLASPYMALWSMAQALRQHDQRTLNSSLDWTNVRDGLKQSLGLRSTIQPVSQQNELPDFGESFATGVASGMVDEDITPERLASLLDGPIAELHPATSLPHGFFTGATRFEARIPMPGAASIEIAMHVEKWRWKITRIALPAELLAPPTPTHMASSRT